MTFPSDTKVVTSAVSRNRSNFVPLDGPSPCADQGRQVCRPASLPGCPSCCAVRGCLLLGTELSKYSNDVTSTRE